MDTLYQDVRYALRILRKSPSFALIAVLTLALGIGANTAIFTVVDAVLLRSLPYPQAAQLVSIDGGQSRPDLQDFEQQGHTLSQVGAFAEWHFDLVAQGEPQQVKADLISLSLFQALGVNAELGRTLSPQDDQLGGEPVVVVSHNFWQQRLGGDAHALGRVLNLTGKNYTIVGVMPASFKLPRGQAELFVPFRVGYPEAANERGVHFQYAIARVAPGASLAQAQSEIDAIAAGLSQRYPEEDRDRHFSLVPLQERVVRNARQTLLVLLGAVGFVLLIASANFANLLLARASGRRAEAQVRLALGALPGRLIRQLLTESVLLAALGGALGIALAYGGLRVLLAMRADNLPSLSVVNIDSHVLLFALAVSLLTGCIFGLMPAIEAASTALRSNVGGTARQESRSASGLRRALIIGEVSLSIVLLCGSGLLIRSLVRLQNQNPGFNPSGLLIAELWLPDTKYHQIPPQDRLLRNVLEGLQHTAGVQSAALVTELPLSGQNLTHNFIIAGRPPIPVGSEPDAETSLVSPDYFHTLEIPILKGRAFLPSDRADTPLVAIINQSMARQYWPGEDPIGSRIRFARQTPSEWLTVVGVTGDVKSQGLDQDEGPMVYTSIFPKQEPWRRWAWIVVRSVAGPPSELASAVKKQVWAFDSQLPLVQVHPMEWLLDDSLAERRFNTLLLGILAAGSLLLAMIGVYGVISYAVSQRTREFGIRMAVGASRAHLLRLVIGQGFRVVLLGVVLGLIAAAALTRVLSGMLFGVSAGDALTFVSATVVLVAVALLACYVPARRATKVDPVVALRWE